MTKKMKIVYAVPEALPDSRARFIQIINTCLSLAKAGAETILIAGIRKGYTGDSILEFYGIPSHPKLKILQFPLLRKEDSSRFGISWHGIFHISLLLYLLRKKSYFKGETVLFLRHIKLANFLLKFMPHIDLPVIFEVHEIFHLGTRDRKKRKRNKKLEYKVYNHADALICTSNYLKERLLEITDGSESIHVIRHGIKKEWFNIRKSGKPSYICYTGSLYGWKGVDTLISAMKYLPEERLIVVGRGSRLSELRRKTEKEGTSDRIVFTGRVAHTEIPGYLSGAKAAVLPNVLEGQSIFSSPLKLFEYMACGVPVLASDFPVFKEILQDHKNCLLFEPGNPKALARCVRELDSNPGLAERIAETARQDAKNFTYAKRAEEILKVARSYLG